MLRGYLAQKEKRAWIQEIDFLSIFIQVFQEVKKAKFSYFAVVPSSFTPVGIATAAKNQSTEPTETFGCNHVVPFRVAKTPCRRPLKVADYGRKSPYEKLN